MEETRFKIGPGLRTRAQWRFFAGFTDDHTRITLTVEERDIQGETSVEHTPTDPAWSEWSFTYEEREGERWKGEVGCGANLPDAARRVVKRSAHPSDPAEWHGALDLSELEELAAIGEEWHLNGMRSGCAHQVPVYETDRFGHRVPSLDLTPACPETGYRYGSAWLVEPMASADEKRLRELLAKVNRIS